MSEQLFKEIYQFLFVVSTTYLTCVVLLFLHRFIRRVKYKANTTMVFNVIDKILLLASLGIIIAYLI